MCAACPAFGTTAARPPEWPRPIHGRLGYTRVQLSAIARTGIASSLSRPFKRSCAPYPSPEAVRQPDRAATETPRTDRGPVSSGRLRCEANSGMDSSRSTKAGTPSSRMRRARRSSSATRAARPSASAMPAEAPDKQQPARLHRGMPRRPAALSVPPSNIPAMLTCPKSCQSHRSHDIRHDLRHTVVARSPAACPTARARNIDRHGRQLHRAAWRRTLPIQPPTP